MKKLLPFLLITSLLLAACSTAAPADPAPSATAPALVKTQTAVIPYESRFDSETAITLSDDGIRIDGGGETDAVFTSHDIVYYENKTAYDSGYPYGEGTQTDMHTADEAAAHTVVNITAPGAYRISGKLSQGQIRIDLGEEAYSDESAVVELILDGADITCTVAPAIVFRNVYECDNAWSADTAESLVDTTAAGANLILEGENTVTGSHVTKIFKDQEGEKKLWKQDGAIYSYMSMNVYGPGSLELTADNEGIDTELHLTINGGKIAIRSGNDGINTNEDGVSVTTINAGDLHIIAGLGDEGDGIDSNGWLVINGGTVVSSANPAADAGLDSDMGSFINGGTVIALGSTMDWAESDSGQVTMNLQFAGFQSSDSSIAITYEDGTVAFAYAPGEDEVLGENIRRYQGAVISSPNLVQGCTYQVWMGGSVTGEETGGVYDATTVTAHKGGTRMMYTGTDVIRGFGGMGGQRPDKPEDFDPDQIPEGEMPSMPADFEGHGPGGNREEMPEGERPTLPEGETMPENFDPGAMGHGRFPGGQSAEAAEGNALFYMQDMVNFFSGLTAVTE